MKQSRLVIGICYHPELYPPTLNAVRELSKCFTSIRLVHRPHLEGTWKYPANVTTVASGAVITPSEQERASTIRKIWFFLQFVTDLFRECVRLRPAVILLYDHQALFAYRLIRPFLFFRHKLWYHNHDIAELAAFRKFSIGWMACRSEKKMFSRLDIFTLPTSERLQYFPMEKFKGHYFIVPNYPSLEFYNSFYKPGKDMGRIRLIFQGRIGEGHGLEEIIPLLKKEIRARRLELVLKGHISQEYKDRLLRLAVEHDVTDSILFAGVTPYAEVPEIASSCHIGIGIFSKREVMHVTLGTASNKLYEYAAVGLPVLYLGEDHFSRHLSQFEWTFAVSLDTGVIEAAIGRIMDNYEYYSVRAHESFANGLNFEGYFAPVLDYLKDQGFCSPAEIV
ncbi:MAG TPA: hypothetical protein VL727_12895 [Puia sp.]|nr:hypothetical protein [Puia sp.]